MRPYKDFFLILWAFTIWRLMLFFFAYLSPSLITTFGDRFPYYKELLIFSKLPQTIWAFVNFDGVHYIRIANQAYSNQHTQAFFPGYPLIVRGAKEVIEIIPMDERVPVILGALLVSNIAFFFGLVIFYKLLKGIYDRKIALWSTIFMLTFPTSFYFGSAYTEGMFFLMIISSFYLLEKKRILAASIIGSFASATRLIGVFMAPALMFYQKKRSLMPLFIVPIGFLLYVLFLQIKYDNPLYFLTAQDVFQQDRSTTKIVLLPQVFYRYVKILISTQGLAFAIAALELISTVFVFACLFFAWRMKMRTQWLIFSFFAVIVPTLTGTLVSMPRYIAIAFPIYIVLAHIKSTPVKIAIALIFTVGLFITTVLFAQGYWVA